MITNNVKLAEIPRGELSLPHMYFVMVDDWEPKLGAKALFKWFKLITMADRSDPERKNDKVPRPLANIAKDWGMGKSTLYNQIIKPLWNFGLIDLEEYEPEKQKNKKSQKPVNIIVYRAPLNDTGLLSKPLQKVRDYDTQYNSEARINALKKKDGGTVPEQDGQQQADPEPLPDKNSGFNTVPEQDGGPSQDRTGDRPEIGQNNYLKSFNNSFKTINNEEEEERKRARVDHFSNQLKQYKMKDDFIKNVMERLSEIIDVDLVTETSVKIAAKKLLKKAADPKGKITYPERLLAKYIATEANRFHLAGLGMELEEKQAAGAETIKRPVYNWLEN